MRKTVVQIAVIGLIAGAAYLFIFQRDMVKSWFGEVQKNVSGYTDAETPEECVEKFSQAIKERDFQALPTYLTGSFKVEVEKIAERAEELAEAIDNLRNAMETHDVKSKKVSTQLAMMDPFFTISVAQVKSKSETEAKADIQVKLAVSAENQMLWGEIHDTVSHFQRCIVGGIIPEKEYTVKKMDDGSWKIDFKLQPAYPAFVTTFNDNVSQVIKAIDVVKTAIKRDATYQTRDGFEKKFLSELNLGTKIE